MGEFRLRAIHLAHDPAGVFQELAPGGRQPHAARQPLEQRRAELRLHGLHVPGQCGLGDTQLHGRARDAAGVGDMHEEA